MKKRIIMLLFAVMTVGLVACTSTGKDTSKDETEVSDEEEDINDEDIDDDNDEDPKKDDTDNGDIDSDDKDDTDVVFDEEMLYAKLINNTYETEQNSDGESNLYQFYLINGRLLMEKDDYMDGYGYCYSAAEVFPDNTDVLFEQCENKIEFEALIRQFSGFSMGGAYWNSGEKIRISLDGDELKLTDESGNETVAVKTPDHKLTHPETKDLLEAMGISDPRKDDKLIGAWKAFGDDGQEIYIEFGEDNTLIEMSKTPGTPIVLYRGIYVVNNDMQSFMISAQRFGYGEMPIDYEYRYEPEGNKLVLKADDYALWGRSELTYTPADGGVSPNRMQAPEEDVIYEEAYYE